MLNKILKIMETIASNETRNVNMSVSNLKNKENNSVRNYDNHDMYSATEAEILARYRYDEPFDRGQSLAQVIEIIITMISQAVVSVSCGKRYHWKVSILRKVYEVRVVARERHEGYAVSLGDITRDILMHEMKVRVVLYYVIVYGMIKNDMVIVTGRFDCAIKPIHDAGSRSYMLKLDKITYLETDHPVWLLPLWIKSDVQLEDMHIELTDGQGDYLNNREMGSLAENMSIMDFPARIGSIGYKSEPMPLRIDLMWVAHLEVNVTEYRHNLVTNMSMECNNLNNGRIMDVNYLITQSGAYLSIRPGTLEVFEDYMRQLDVLDKDDCTIVSVDLNSLLKARTAISSELSDSSCTDSGIEGFLKMMNMFIGVGDEHKAGSGRMNKMYLACNNPFVSALLSMGCERVMFVRGVTALSKIFRKVIGSSLSKDAEYPRVSEISEWLTDDIANGNGILKMPYGLGCWAKLIGLEIRYSGNYLKHDGYTTFGHLRRRGWFTSTTGIRDLATRHRSMKITIGPHGIYHVSDYKLNFNDYEGEYDSSIRDNDKCGFTILTKSKMEQKWS